MARFATGVAVVATVHDGVRYGMTVSSLASVSLDPVHSDANIGEAIGSSGAGEQIIAPGTPQIHVEKEMGHVADVFGVDESSIAVVPAPLPVPRVSVACRW